MWGMGGGEWPGEKAPGESGGGSGIGGPWGPVVGLGGPVGPAGQGVAVEGRLIREFVPLSRKCVRFGAMSGETMHAAPAS